MKTRFDLIHSLIEKSIPFVFDGEDIRVEGFSKSGEAILVWHEDGYIAYTRYEQMTAIHSIKDLLDLAYVWYKTSAYDYKLPNILRDCVDYPAIKDE